MMILHGSAAQVKSFWHPVSCVKKAVDGELEVHDALKKSGFHVVWRAWRRGPPIGREVMHDIEGSAPCLAAPASQQGSNEADSPHRRMRQGAQLSHAIEEAS